MSILCIISMHPWSITQCPLVSNAFCVCARLTTCVCAQLRGNSGYHSPRPPPKFIFIDAFLYKHLKSVALTSNDPLHTEGEQWQDVDIPPLGWSVFSQLYFVVYRLTWQVQTRTLRLQPSRRSVDVRAPYLRSLTRVSTVLSIFCPTGMVSCRSLLENLKACKRSWWLLLDVKGSLKKCYIDVQMYALIIITPLKVITTSCQRLSWNCNCDHKSICLPVWEMTSNLSSC